MWERDKLSKMMLELLNIVICLGDARDLSEQDNQRGNKTLETAFGSNAGGSHKGNFLKRKFEAKANQEDRGSKASFKKKAGQVDLKVAKENGTCYKYGEPDQCAKDYKVIGKNDKVLRSITLEVEPIINGSLELNAKDEAAESKLLLQRGNMVLKNINLWMIVKNGGYEATLSAINLGKEELLYL